jgi:hypothetical protein
MTERDAFERRFGAAVRGYAGRISSDLDPVELAHRIAVGKSRRRGFWAAIGWRGAVIPRVAWLLLLVAGLLVALLGGMLFVGSQPVRRLPAVVPPLPAFECPPGSSPDEPGPIDQVVPLGAGWPPVAFDRRAGKLIALAANTAGDQETWTVETWTFDVCTNTWTRMHPDREPPALVSGLVYDVDSDVTIGVQYKDWLYPELIGNVWAYDLEANTWTEHGAAPTRETGFYDPVSGLVVAGAVYHDLWSYDVETDTWAPIRHSPREDLDYGEYVYDASVDRIVEYAGSEDVVEIQLFDIRTGAWSRSGAEIADYSMHAWALPAIVYDEAAERTVVAGADRWGAYDAAADRWEILFNIDGENRPDAPAVYDPTNRRLIVFGGGIGVSGDLVAFDLVTREWTVLLEPGTGRATP